jgi:20S proteasome alpha/beta subunit
VLYNRRNKFDPLWNSLVIAGVEKGVSFLGTVAMIGTQFEDSHIATGFGAHLARPLFRCVSPPSPRSTLSSREKCCRSWRHPEARPRCVSAHALKV